MDNISPTTATLSEISYIKSHRRDNIISRYNYILNDSWNFATPLKLGRGPQYEKQ
jgi:hypothetical protein